MFENTGMTWGLYKSLLWLAQTTPDTTEQLAGGTRGAFVLAGLPFFVSLVAGVILALAFQLVLTNLSVAVGISYLGHQSDSDSSDNNNDGDGFGGTIRKIGTAVGVWTLVTVSISLFIACYLAVRLSLGPVDSRDLSLGPVTFKELGLILGLVIWAAYFTLLFVVSSTTVGSLIGNVVNTASSGLKAILGTATAAWGAKAVNDQVVATAEAAAAAVRRELGSGLDPESLKETLQDYVEKLRPPELDFTKIRGEFEKLLNDPQLKAIGPENLRNIDRSKFVELVSGRTDLSKRDVNRLVDQLETVWKQVVDKQAPQTDGMAELLNYLKSAQPGQLRDELNAKLEQVLSEVRSSQQSGQQSGEKQDRKSPGFMQQSLMTGFNSLLGVAMGRTDLSDLDLEKILGQLRSARDKVTEQADKLATTVKPDTAALPYSTIRADVENYLLNSYTWQMNRETLNREFRDVLYDPQAAPGAVRQELEQLKRSDFVELLQQKGIFTQDKINEIADRLESIRQDVLQTAQIAEEQEISQELRRRVEEYLHLVKKEDLNPDAIERDFGTLLQDADASEQQLSDRLSQFDRQTLMQLVLARNDIPGADAEFVVNYLERTRDHVLRDAREREEQARVQNEALWVKLESYLRNTGKEELNPDAIQRDIRTFLDDPQAGAVILRSRLSRFDRDTLVQLLSTRQDINQDQANKILDSVEQTWKSVLHSPQKVAGKAKEQLDTVTGKAKEQLDTVTDKAKEQYDTVTTTITEYLRNTGKDELNPEGIKRDLTKLVNNPKEGSLALRSRLSKMDRDTLVKLLSQREDLSEEQVNQVIDQVQDTIRGITKAPRRLAARTQARVQDFQSTLNDYLQNTGKDELNPEGIKRDLQLLLNDPRTGMESLSDRLSKFDRSTLVSLLSQREDISEEEANQIVDRVLSVRDQFVEQVRNIQRRIQDAIEGVFASVRTYLNSLERPELNYDSIKQDVRTLFDDPQAGFDALRDRLSHFNRDTLVALISSREDISEADANRIIDQIERTRNSVLQRAERIQQQAQQRLENVKRQAQRQADETRKAAASAAWWLFGTAIVSAFASAIGGAIAR